ncbi:MAG TPA: hypothetical protein VF221_05200 [Chloroflexota bacterium]
MKRFGVLGMLVSAALLASHGATHAQTPPTTTSTATPTVTATPGSTATPTATPPPVKLLNPTAFALSAWYFPPPASILTNQVETNDMATGEGLILHLGTQSFAAEGRTTGYFVDSGVRNLDSHGAQHPVFTRYLVSMFPSVLQASSAFAQQLGGWHMAINDPTSSVNGQLVPVSIQVGDQMSKGIYQAQLQTSGGTAVLSELLFQRGPYFVEVWQQIYQKDVAAYSAADQPFMLSLARSLDTVASGQRLPALPKPTAKLHMQSVRFEANGTKQGISKAPLKSAKTGSKVELGAYYVVTSAPPRSQDKGDYWLTMGRRTLHKTYKHTLGTYPPDYYHQYVYNVLVPRAGTYHLRVVISIGKISASGTASLRVSSKGLVTLTTHSGVSLLSGQNPMIQMNRLEERNGAASFRFTARGVRHGGRGLSG